MIAKISYDRNASQTVAFAAEELASYLSRMMPEEEVPQIRLAVNPDTKTRLGCKETPDAGSRQEMSAGESTDAAAKCPDGYSVQIGPEGGSITGCNDRSVLLGVYDYLHHLGCRFLGPGKACEIVPRITPQALPASYEKQASFYHRGVCIEGANSLENILDFIDWLPKVGYNSFFLQFKVPYTFLARWYQHGNNVVLSPEKYSVADAAADTIKLEAAIRKRDLLLHKVGHGWTGEVLGYESVAWEPDGTPLSPEKRHMAAEVGGKRELFEGVPLDTNLCYHDPDAAEAFVSLVVEYARENPAVDYLHIWLADDYNNVCECEECRKTTLSDQYVALLNEIDRRLTAERLETRLVFLLYQELLWPPVKERLEHPERFLLMFAPISRTFESSYPLEDPVEEIPPYRRNQITLPTSLQMNLAYLKGWQQIFKGDGFVYDYPLGRAHYGDFGYVHISRIIGSDIRKLKQMGLNGYISCQELRVVLPNALPNYVMGYTLFDETADTEALIEEYFEAAYGEGAAQAKAHLSELSRLGSCDYLNGKGPRVNEEMAGRLAEICRICEEFGSVLEDHCDSAGEWDSLFWKLLGYHASYIHKLAGAMGHIARGENAQAAESWRSLQKFISENETGFQPYLDVYRILEVTKNYTGFRRLLQE